MDNILEVNNLTVEIDNGRGYEKVKAVNDLSLTLAKGKTLGIVGESGSGKTVTSLCVCGLQNKNTLIKSGNIVFDGIDLLSNSGKTNEIRGRDMSIIFQDPLSSLNPLMKIGRQVEESARLHTSFGKREIRAMAKKAMEYAELKDIDSLYNAYPHQLSGGMRQRVMIAAAIILSPRLLIADEPTTSLDASVQAQIVSLFKKLKADSDLSIIFISHNFDVIRQLSDYVAVMYKGCAMEYGECGDIIGSPAHPYTKALIKCIPTPESKGKPLYQIKDATVGTGLGCPFAPRCGSAKGLCFTNMPEYKNINGRFIRCFEHGENADG